MSIKEENINLLKFIALVVFIIIGLTGGFNGY
jgi:hypothetical protein